VDCGVYDDSLSGKVSIAAPLDVLNQDRRVKKSEYGSHNVSFEAAQCSDGPEIDSSSSFLLIGCVSMDDDDESSSR